MARPLLEDAPRFILAALVALSASCQKTEEPAGPGTKTSLEAAPEAADDDAARLPPAASLDAAPEATRTDQASAPQSQTDGGRSGLSPDQLKATMAPASPRVRACIDAIKKGSFPEAGGAVFVRLEIDGEGHVKTARLADAPPTTIKDAKLTDCLLGVVRGLKFPAGRDGAPTVVDALPFRINVED